MSYTSQNLRAAPNFFQNGFYAVQSDAPFIQMGFNNEYRDMQFLKMLNTGSVKSVFTERPNGVYERQRVDSPYRNATVLTRTVSGNNLILTFTEPDIDYIRDTEVLCDPASATNAIVQFATKGTVTIEPLDAPAFPASVFAVGAIINVVGGLATIHRSGGLTNLTRDSRPETFLSAIFRDSANTSSRANIQLQYIYGELGGQKNKLYSYTDDQAQAAIRLMIAKVYMGWRGKNVITQTSRGAVAQPCGIDYAIQKDGEIIDITSPPTAAYLRQLVQQSLSISSQGNQDILIAGGRLAIENIRQLIAPAVIASGDRNTYNVGPGEGIRSMGWRESDANIQLSVVPFLANQEVGSPATGLANLPGTMAQNTFYIFNRTPIPTVGGGTVGRVQDLYWKGEDAMEEGKLWIKGIPGMRGDTGQAWDSAMGAGAQMTASPIDAAMSELLWDGGHVMNMTGCIKVQPYVA